MDNIVINENKRIVYICSPLSGNYEKNMENVKEYAKNAILYGVSPIVPHFYSLFLDDTNPDQREIGLKAAINLIRMVDEVWVHGDEISTGMEQEIEFANSINVPVFRIVGGRSE